MNKLDVFIAASKLERWRWRYWRAAILSVSFKDFVHPDATQNDLELWSAFSTNKDALIEDIADYPRPYDIKYDSDATRYYSLAGKWEVITDAKPMEALFDNREVIELKVGDIPNLKVDTTTTLGRALFNWMCIVNPFGIKIDYVQQVTAAQIAKIVSANVKSDDVDLDDTTSFRVREFAVFVQSLSEITSICTLITPVTSQRALKTHPDLYRVRDALYEQYKDQLGDRAVIAMIQDKLVDMDIEYLSNDESAEFYISKKSYSVKRKKLLMMHGIEDAFSTDGTFELIKTSLSEGSSVADIVATNNSTREGVHARGSDTAKAGEKVTFMQRIHQNTKVVPGDCGTKLVYTTTLTPLKALRYKGLNIMVNNRPLELTEEVANQYMGQIVNIRRPILCKAPNTDFCSVCVGPKLADNPRAIAGEIVAIASHVMYAFMAAMHGVELAVSRYDPKINLR